MRKGICIAFAFLATSCAGYTKATKAGFQAFQNRDFTQAELTYTPGAEEDSKDQLVYLFDRGTVRYTAGQYESSIKDFLLADDLSEIKDYTALGTEMASIFVNDQILTYKGEEFEHVLASMYLALNFAAVGKDEEAVVAARRVNRRLERLRDEAKRTYQLNAFAQYLAGLVRERQGNWNHAYVDYKKTLELAPQFSRLKKDLIKGALWTESSSDLHKWKRTLGVTAEEVQEAKEEFRKTGGIVLLFQNGFGPEKVPHSQWHELPEFRTRYNKHRWARLYVDGEEAARTEVLYDVEKVAIENLQQKYALYVAKRIAGVIGREVLGNELDKQKEGLGTLVKIAMAVASQADLRSWSTLPKDFQVARVQRPPGNYRVSLRLEDIYGALSDEISLGEVTIKKGGDLHLLQYRSLND